VIGTGYQGETQVIAIDSVRELKEIRVFSRTPEKRKYLLDRIQRHVRAKLIDSSSAEECVAGADIICTITSSKEPVLLGRWLKQGCHVNAAGSNWANKRELDDEAVKRCGFICADDRQQSKIESGDLISVLKEGDWEKVAELSDVVRGKVGRDSPDQITLFKSNGVAVEDVSAARYVHSRLVGG
jgi:ornithine cyclodeaminase/alanine dehydrogenase-like protein (mu-crystallin family)